MDTSPNQLPLGDAFLASFERNKQAADETAVVALPRSAREADDANQLDQYFGELYKLPLPTLAARERSLADEAEKEAVGVLLDRKAEEKFAELSQAEGYENSVRWLAEQRRLGEIDDDFLDAAFVIVKEKARQPIPGVSLQDAWEAAKASPMVAYDLYKGVKGLAKYVPTAIYENWANIARKPEDRKTVGADVLGASVLQGTGETFRLATRLKRALFSDVSDYSEENLKKRLDSDLKFYEFVRAVESGEAFPDLTPDDVEYISSIGELTSIDNAVPFGFGFTSVKKAAKVAAATKLETRAAKAAREAAEKVAADKASVGTVRKATGDVVESVGKGMEKVAESPAARALGAVTGATMSGGSPPVILMAAIGATSDAAEAVAKRPGKMVQGVGQSIKKPLKPGSPSSRLSEIMKDTGTAAFYGTVGMTPFASIAETPEERGTLLAGGGVFGAAGGGVAQVKNGVDSFGNSLWKPEEANDSVARAPVTNYGSSLDATHAAYVNTLPASTANRVEALRALVGQPMFTLDPVEYDAIVKTDSQGVTDIVLEDGTKAILVRGGGSALGHESGHSIFRSLPTGTQQSIIDAVFKAYGPEGVADMKALYESSGISLKDDAAAVEEIIADNFQVLFNGGPLGQLGTPKGVAAAIYSSLGSLAERVGIRDLRPGGQVQTSETLKFTPSYLVQEALRTAVEAMNLDGYKAALEGTGGAIPTQPGGAPSPAQAPVAPREGGGPVDDLTPPPRAAQKAAPPVDVGASVPVPAELVVDPQSPIRPKGVTGEADISQLAKDLLEEVDNGGRPSKATIERVARENGINTTSLTTLIAELQAKRVRAGAVLPQTPAAQAPQQAPDILTPEAQAIVNQVDAGGAAPAFISRNLERIARENGVEITDQMTPRDVVNALREKSKKTPAQAPVEPAAPEEAAPQQAPVQAPPRRPNVRVTRGQQEDFIPPTPEQQAANAQRLQELANRPRSQQAYVETEYFSAEPVTGTEPDAPRRLAQRQLADKAEAEYPGYRNPLRAPFQKIFAPYKSLGGNKIIGFSFDKLIQNLDILAGWAGGQIKAGNPVQLPYDLSSPELRRDVQTYLKNHANGYAGDGRSLKRPADTAPGTIPDENLGYTPVSLEPVKAQFINLLMGLEPPKKTTAAAEFNRRFAEQNGLAIAETPTGSPEVNILRAQLRDSGFDSSLLNGVLEVLRTDRITGEIKERADINLGVGEGAFIRAGFMPSSPARTGLEFKKFFSDVTRGTFGKSDIPFIPETNIAPELYPVIEALEQHSGNFDDHIAKSIPTFYETQIGVIGALSKFPEGSRLLDIAASEGSFGKTVTELSNGNVTSVSLDPNPDMARFFREKSQVPGAEYSTDAFLNGFEDGGVQVPAYRPTEKFNIVHESMGFQFIDPDRAAQVAEVKRLMTPDGVFITEQKLRNPKWAANEVLKDSRHKNKYFTPSELQAKDKVVGFAQSKSEAQAVGMVDNMAPKAAYEQVLKDNFRYVAQYWDAGNFKGYAASDSLASIGTFFDGFPLTTSQFATTAVPRWVGRDVSFMPSDSKFTPLESEGLDFDKNQADIRYLPAKELTTQFESDKKRGSLGGVQQLVHFSSVPMKTLDPKKSSGKGAATPTDLRGMKRGYFYRLKKGAYESGIADRPYTYMAQVDGNSIYDLAKDPLGYRGIPDREKADQMLIDAGFAGMRGKVGAIDMVAMFKPVKVTEATAEDVYTKKQLAEQRRQRAPLEEEEIDYQAEDEAWEAEKARRWPSRQFMPGARQAPTRTLSSDVAAQFMPAASAAPRVDLADYIGRDVVSLTTDRLDVGEKEVGPEGAKRAISRKAQGGRGFPLVYTGMGWAFSNKESASRFLTRLRISSESDSALVATSVLDEKNVLNSPFGQLAIATAYRNAVESGFVTEQQANATIKEIFSRAAAAANDKDMAKIKTLADYEKAVEAWPFNFGKTRQIVARLNAATLKIPKEIRQAVGLNALSVARSISDPELAGLPNFAFVSMMEIPLDQVPVKDDVHVSYPYSVKGKLLGFLKTPFLAEKLIDSQKVYNRPGQISAQPMMTVMPSIDALKPSEINPDPESRLEAARLSYAAPLQAETVVK